MLEDNIEVDKEAVEAVSKRLEEQGLEASPPIKEENDVANMSNEEVVKLASEFGWSDQGPKSAEEFIRYGLQNLEPRGKELKELKQTINELKNHMKKTEEKVRAETIEELRSQRYDAIALGDAGEVDRIESEMKTFNKGSDSKPLPEVEAFAERNKEWVTGESLEDKEMQAMALVKDQEFAKYNLEPEVHLKLIEREIKKEFPERFTDSNENMVPAVESGAGMIHKSKKAKFSYKDLNTEQKKCYNLFKEQGIMTGDEYIESLAKLGELE